MKKTLFTLLIMVFFCGCQNSATYTTYGPRLITYKGPPDKIAGSCTLVMHDIGKKVVQTDGSIHHPTYKEHSESWNIESVKENATLTEYECEGENNEKYNITLVSLPKKPEVLILKAEGADLYKLTNSLIKKFNDEGIKANK